MKDEQEWSVDQEEVNRLASEGGNDVSPVVLEDLNEGSLGDALGSLDRLHDVSLPIRVVFGTKKMTIQEVIDIREGSIVTLNRFAGEAVDIVIGDRVVAKGEISVVDNEKFGVKLSEILWSGERLD